MLTSVETTLMTIERGSTALLLLDLQRDFLDPDGVYARHGLPVERLRGIRQGQRLLRH